MTAVEQARTTRTAPAENASLLASAEDPGVFRFPAPEDPAPGQMRMLAMALYGTALGLTGVGVGLYAVIAVFGGAPGWYLPVLGLLTLLSVVPTAAAFLAIHERNLPWWLLIAAAPPMAAAVAVALSY
ncbi:hypothetical protein ACTI_30090 [Actinoplanes sp. OR16]|uniref:hypothetical protein n=1 Tax=Actinoplanes sp. OR16 TaxID=946334 RepID=UPI000F6E7098|nr:hypothetical protein [Actinoplanes sp. OR16]BBH66324.1 hypothetical protein ACTI_30090 [Actinoplanes sp. OR16]